MIRSMTAFTRKETKYETWTATWEIRSVNHRYLEIQIYLPEIFKDIEIEIRKTINNTDTINRGRLECKLHIINNNNNYNDILNNEINLNTQLIKNIIQSIQSIPEQKKLKKIDPIKILSWPGVITPQKTNIHIFYPTLLKSFQNTLCTLIKNREKEGSALEKIIKKRIYKINYEIDNIKNQIPNIMLHQRKQLLKKIQALNININHHRLEEELIIYAQKSDITEEIDRLIIHIKNINDTLYTEKVVGRKLDFIMQELHREINTILSKSIDIAITQSSIKIKVWIEQIREQVQNIE